MTATVTLANELLRHTSSGIVFPLSMDAWASLGEPWDPTDYREASPWIIFVLPISRDRSTSQATVVTSLSWAEGFIPRTALGKKLMSLRQEAIVAGMRLLSEEEVLEEVKRRRGELENHDTDLY